MALTDPLSVNVAGSAVPLARVSTGANQSNYQSADGNLQLKVASTYGKSRTSRVISLDSKKISSDPFKPAENVVSSLRVNITIQEPLATFTVAERVLHVKGVAAMIQASSDAILTKWLGGEN